MIKSYRVLPVLLLLTSTAALAQDATAPVPEVQAVTATTTAPATEVPAVTAAPVSSETVAQTNATSVEIAPEIAAAIGKPEPGKALVVFFRPSAFVGSMIGFIVRENDVELGKLRNGNYFTLQVEPGKHSYVVHSEAKDVTAMELEEGETYFLSGEINMGFMAGRPNLSPSDILEFSGAFKKLKPSKPLK